MFGMMKKIISKVIGWGIRKLGGSLKDVVDKMVSFGLDTKDPGVKSSAIEAMNDIDFAGTYDDIDYDSPVPKNLLIETDDKLSRNYLTKVDVYWKYSLEGLPHAEILSLTHNENLSLREIEERIYDILNEYSLVSEFGDVEIKNISRVTVHHKRGNEY